MMIAGCSDTVRPNLTRWATSAACGSHSRFVTHALIIPAGLAALDRPLPVADLTCLAWPRAELREKRPHAVEPERTPRFATSHGRTSTGRCV